MTKAPEELNIEAARAIIAGELMPAAHPWHGATLAGRCREMTATPPIPTDAELAELFPAWPEKVPLFDRDDEPLDPEAADECTAWHNSLSPVGRAIDEVLYTLDQGIDEDYIRNPIYLHELRRAQRRTLQRLLELAVQPPSSGRLNTGLCR